MHTASLLIITPESTFEEVAKKFLLESVPSERWSSLGEPFDVKTVDSFLKFAGLSGKNKRAVLFNADTWSQVVSNRLLKVLEEPPSGLTLLVLSASEKILPTVASRLIRLPTVFADTEGAQIKKKHFLNTGMVSRMRETLLLLASSHPGHDVSKLLQATDSHL